ncbi:13299_t:CDS:2 [Gigaspora rosea]|nr:13299_t:CDS:2 [Gigaspora rosea]
MVLGNSQAADQGDSGVLEAVQLFHAVFFEDMINACLGGSLSRRRTPNFQLGCPSKGLVTGERTGHTGFSGWRRGTYRKHQRKKFKLLPKAADIENWRGECTITLPTQVIINENQKYSPGNAPKDGVLSTTQEIEAFYTMAENSSSDSSDDELSDWTEKNSSG